MLALCFRFGFSLLCLFWSKELKHGEDDTGDIPFVITAHVFCTDQVLTKVCQRDFPEGKINKEIKLIKTFPRGAHCPLRFVWVQN